MPPTMPARQRCSFHLEVDVAGADAGDDAGDKTRHRGDAADVDQIAVYPGDDAGDDPHPGAEQDAAGHNGDDAHVNQRSFDVDAGIGAEQREQREDRRDDAELERRMVFFAAVGGTAGCGSGKQTDQHQRGAIKHRQQHFKKGARRVLAAAYGWRQYTTAKGAVAPRAGISPCRAAFCPAASAGRRWRGRRNPPRSRRGEVRRRSAVDKARQLALQIGIVFSQPARRRCTSRCCRIRRYARSPPRGSHRSAKDRVARLQIGGKSHLIKGMPLFRDRQRAPGAASHRSSSATSSCSARSNT